MLTASALTVALASCVAVSPRAFSPHDDPAPWVASPAPAQGTHQMPEVPARVVSFDTTEGTFMNVDVSPDGETLIFDLLGDIYSLPLTGGQAVPFTSGRAWDEAPRFSPDGAHVYFVSDREGYKNIWRLTLHDASLRQVTRSASDIRGGPDWSQGGSHFLVGRGDPGTQNTEFTLHSVDPDTGNMTLIDAPNGPWVDLDAFEILRPRITIYSGVESADGEVFFSQSKYVQELRRTTVRMYKFDRRTQTRTTITPEDASYSEYKPLLSHGGNLLAYFRQYNDRRTEIRILNRRTGQDEALTKLTAADDATYTTGDVSRPNYAFTPDDLQLVFWHGGKIHRVDLVDGSRGIIPFRVSIEREIWERAEPPTVKLGGITGEAKIVRWPSLSRDGQTITFAAIGYVWVMDVESGAVRRLTRSTDFEYMPAPSPDGMSVAYISFAQTGDNDYGPGRLVVADVDDGTPRDVLAALNETWLLPRWSPDGRKIAVIRETENEDGLEASFGWTPAASGGFHEIAAAPASSDYASVRVYSRFVGFDETSRNLLMGFPRSQAETVLISADLDGGPLRTLAIGTPEVGGITPAPDLNHLALTRDDGTVWVVPFGPGEERSVSTLASDARRVSRSGGYYVDWNQPRQLTFGFAQNIWRYRLDGGNLESLRVEVPFPKAHAEQPIAFKGARLITLANDAGAGPVIETGTVVIDGVRIAAIGPAGDVQIPSDALVIDATGKTIMPGLLDTHYHRIGGGNGVIGVSAFKLPNGDFSDPSAIRYGVTMAWEPGAPADDAVPATVDLQTAGRIAGPRWSHSAMGSVGYPRDLFTSYSFALEAVAKHKELGVDVLKEAHTPTREQRQWLSAAAHEYGLGIVSHLETFGGMMTRIVDGYTGGDHPYIPVPFYKDVHEMLKQTGYIWTPNAVITPGTVGAGQRKNAYFCQAVLTWRNRTDPRIRATDPICAADQASPSVPYDILRISRVARQAASEASNGVHIGVSAHNMPGSNLHQEMWHLSKGGMPIEDVLRAATMGNAEKLGLQEEVGSLELGKIADFLVLDANPLDDILNTMSLRYTVQGGVVYDSDTALPADFIRFPDTDVASLQDAE